MTAEWRDVLLGDVVDFLSGGTPSKQEPRYWTGSIPWVSAKDMKRLFLDDAEDHGRCQGSCRESQGSHAAAVLTVIEQTEQVCKDWGEAA